MMCFSLYTEGIFEYNFVDRKFNPKRRAPHEIRTDQVGHRRSSQKVRQHHRPLRLRPHPEKRQIRRGREVHPRHLQPRSRRAHRAGDRLRRLRRPPRRPRPLHGVSPRGGACISAPPCKCTRKPQKKDSRMAVLFIRYILFSSIKVSKVFSPLCSPTDSSRPAQQRFVKFLRRFHRGNTKLSEEIVGYLIQF